MTAERVECSTSGCGRPAGRKSGGLCERCKSRRRRGLPLDPSARRLFGAPVEALLERASALADTMAALNAREELEEAGLAWAECSAEATEAAYLARRDRLEAAAFALVRAAGWRPPGDVQGADPGASGGDTSPASGA